MVKVTSGSQGYFTKTSDYSANVTNCSFKVFVLKAYNAKLSSVMSH